MSAVAAPPVARRNLLSYVERLPRFGDREAYLWREGVRWRRRSYADLHRRVLSCAAVLRSAGLRPGDPVLVQGPDGSDWVEALLGTLWAGGVAVPLEASTPHDLRGRIAVRSGARLLLAPAEVTPPEGVRRIDPGSWGERAAAVSGPGDDPAPQDRAEIIFTSGTTGDPKGVVLTHGNLIADFAPIERAYQRFAPFIRPLGSLRFLSTLPLSHMFGQAMNVFLPLAMGLTIVLVPARPRDILETARRIGVWGLFTVPRLLDLLGTEIRRELAGQGALDDILRRQEQFADRPFYVQAFLFRRIQRMLGWRFRLIVSGGAALPEAVDLFFRRSGFLVVQGYGLTETAPIVSVSNPFDRKAGSVGRPLSVQEVRLGPGNEVLVRGPNVTPGYLDAQPRGQEDDGWLKTGDVGALDENGRLSIRGRLKEVIVTPEGENVHPGDVESAFEGIPGVRGASVVGLPLEGGERVHAALLLAPGTDPFEVVRRANERLQPKQRVRGHTVWREEDFPRTATGKVRTGPLRERLLELERSTPGTGGGATGEAPRGGAVRRLIAEMARVPAEGLRDDTRLAEGLGFGSLDLVELAARFEEEIGVSLPEDRLGQATIGDLERLLSSARGAEVAAGREGAARAAAVPEPAAGDDATPGAPPVPGEAMPDMRTGAAGATTGVRGALRMPRWTGLFPVRLLRRCFEELILVPFVRLYARPRVVGLEHLNEAKPPYLFVPNHRSFMDSGVFKASLPRSLRGRIAPGMTTRYHRVFFGETSGPRPTYLKEWLQVLLVELLFDVWPLPETAGIRASLSYAGELMDRGRSILIFPEGRHVRPPGMDPFRKGIGIFARDLRAAVIPAYVEGTDAVLPDGRYWPRRGATTLVLGPPLLFPPDADPQETTQRIEEAVRRLRDGAREGAAGATAGAASS